MSSPGNAPYQAGGRVAAQGVLALGGAVATAWWALGIHGRAVVAADSPFPFGLVVAPAVGLLLGAWSVVLPHELGHLFAGLVLRLPIRGVVIGRFAFGQVVRRKGLRGLVALDLTRLPRRGIPARMVLFSVAGPFGGLTAAAMAAAVAASASIRPDVRYLAAGMACGAMPVQLWNLIPASAMSRRSTDGRNALLWMVAPDEQRRKFEQGNQRRAEPASPSIESLKSALLEPDPTGARRALASLFQTLGVDAALNPPLESRTVQGSSPATELWLNTAPTVLAFATRADEPDQIRAAAASLFAQCLTILYVQDVDDDVNATSGIPDLVTLLAECAWKITPDSLPHTTSLALALILQERSDEARRLLRDAADDPTADNEDRGRAQAVRGLAELDSGDLHEARRLAVAASAEAPREFFACLLADELLRTAPTKP